MTKSKASSRKTALPAAGHDYAARRSRLRQKLDSGLVLLPGNTDSPMNYPANGYPFRQDSSFLYFFGLDLPGLIGLIDLEGGDHLFGNDSAMEDVIWTGAQPALKTLAREVGVTATGSPGQLAEALAEARRKGRKIHFLPPYRAEQSETLRRFLGPGVMGSGADGQAPSASLIRAVVELRSRKSPREIAEIEAALEVTREAFAALTGSLRPGRREQEMAGIIEGAFAKHGRLPAYPVILSVRGEILHGHTHGNTMRKGDLLLVDAGAESPGHYASDITRVFPVSGKFSAAQKDIYSLVLKAQTRAISAIRPGVRYLDVHLMASAVMAAGLKELGLMKGDPQEAVAAGAHALFFPHGLGHMLGLDVHDLEGLGEDNVGYDDTVKRSAQFGLAYLRLAKKLAAGNVLTVEPGIYFIPALIDSWRAEKRCADFIDYARVEKFKGFGGIRIEDDALVLEKGCRVLGKPIPKSVTALENALA